MAAAGEREGTAEQVQLRRPMFSFGVGGVEGGDEAWKHAWKSLEASLEEPGSNFLNSSPDALPSVQSSGGSMTAPNDLDAWTRLSLPALPDSEMNTLSSQLNAASRLSPDPALRQQALPDSEMNTLSYQLNAASMMEQASVGDPLHDSTVSLNFTDSSLALLPFHSQQPEEQEEATPPSQPAQTPTPTKARRSMYVPAAGPRIPADQATSPVTSELRSVHNSSVATLDRYDPRALTWIEA
eukprot:COSAG02_NODE_5144_length_4593_cov_2.718514_1_plen_239_part_10